MKAEPALQTRILTSGMLHYIDMCGFLLEMLRQLITRSIHKSEGYVATQAQRNK